MRSRLQGLVLAAALLLVGAMPASAQVVQRDVKMVNPGNVTAWGYYVGPYGGQMLGSPTKSVTLNCVDFFHEVTVGQVWKVNATRLDNGSLSLTRWGGLPNALDLYRQAAWLSTQYAANMSNTQAVKDIQASIWALFSGNAGAPTPSTNSWITKAQQNAGTVNLSEFYVLSDVRGNVAASAQEFIVRSDMPVPGALVLVASGLLALVPAARRRRES
jgi:hypothetical protein